MGLDSHSTMAVLFSSNDSRNIEHNLVRGGRLWDDPLNMVSHGVTDGTNETSGVWFLFKLNSGNSPYIVAYPNCFVGKKGRQLKANIRMPWLFRLLA